MCKFYITLVIHDYPQKRPFGSIIMVLGTKVAGELLILKIFQNFFLYGPRDAISFHLNLWLIFSEHF